MRALATTFALLALTACAVPVDDVGDEDIDGLEVTPGRNADHAMQGLAVPGRWQPTADELAVGDTQDVQFDNAPPWDDGANCTGGATPGAQALKTAFLEYFPQLSSIGVYNCRVIAGTNSMSLHGVGRALDLMIPTVDGDADNTLGDPIAAWLITNAEAMGIQTIIWDHSIWRVSNNPRIHEYTGSNPHVDHLHVEINLSASRKEPPWFAAPFGPEPAAPPFDGCDALPAEGGVVEEDGPCVELHGPAQYWRAITDAGHGGAMLWTNAFDSTTPSNHAEWKLAVTTSGRYDVAVYLDPAHAQFASTRYALDTGTTSVPLVVDQSSADGWLSLGAFDLAAGADVRLHVYDDHDGPVGDQKRIAVDAASVTPVVDAPPPDVPDEPAPDEPAPGDGADEEPAPVDDEDPGTATPARVSILAGPRTSGGCAATTSSSPAAVLALALVALRRRSAARSQASAACRAA